MIYYVEVNLICIVILLIFQMQAHQKMADVSTDQRILKALIWATVVFCASDMAAGLARGQMFRGARALIEISNLLYFESLVVISYLWFLYVTVKRQGMRSKNRWLKVLRATLILGFTGVAITNPLTRFLFGIDENNLYVRGPGIYLHWFIVWLFFLVPTVQAVKMFFEEKQKSRRSEIAPMLYFTVAPVIASLIQMFCYGVTSTQVGITVSIVMICLSRQNSQILSDTLTGLNNRRALEKYISGVLQRGSDEPYVVLMIDVNHFKAVNDEHGHQMGDLALKTVADAIKRACGAAARKLFLCRYGGDEFIIMGVRIQPEALEALQCDIRSELERLSAENHLPMRLTVSIGVAEGSSADENSLRDVIKRADKAMYAVKKLR